MNNSRFWLQVRFCVTLLVTLLFSLTSCNAQTEKHCYSYYMSVDSIMRSELGDSISDIIVGAKHVCMERILTKNDSVSTIKVKKLKSEERSIAKFLFVINENFNDSSVIFTKFSPSLKITFKVSKKVFCTAFVDFGTQQGVIKDDKGHEVKSFALRDDRYIKFANLIFPDDRFLSFMLNQK